MPLFSAEGLYCIHYGLITGDTRAWCGGGGRVAEGTGVEAPHEDIVLNKTEHLKYVIALPSPQLVRCLCATTVFTKHRLHTEGFIFRGKIWHGGKQEAL